MNYNLYEVEKETIQKCIQNNPGCTQDEIVKLGYKIIKP